MSNMKILIIEDEKISAARMFKLTSDAIPDATILGPVPSVKGAKEIIDANPDIELIFSDIRLEDGLSFSLLDSLNTNAVIVFTTAYNEYGIKAFDYNCVSYILKPVQKDDILTALEKYRKRYLIPSMEKVKEMAQAMISEEKMWRKRLVVSLGEKERLVSMSDISYFESEYGNTNVYFRGGGRGSIDQSLTKILPELDPSRFLQVSRQHIIAYDDVLEIGKGSDGKPEIVMNSSSRAPITCTRYCYGKLKDLIGEND